VTLSSKERKRLKRKQVKKTARQEKEKSLQRDRLDEYCWLAEEAFYVEDYEESLRWSLRRLKYPPRDLTIRDLAFRSAPNLERQDQLFPLLSREWAADEISSVDDLYLLGRLALEKKDLALARETFGACLDELYQRRGRKVKSGIKNAEHYLRYVEMMERTSEPRRARTIRGRSGEAPAIRGTSTSTRTPVVDSVDKNESKGPPEPEGLPELTVEFETSGSMVLEAMAARRRSDLKSFELALQAYKHSFRVSYDQLVCLPTLRNVRSLWYQEETARKVMKTLRGRAILADEVGLGKTIEAGIVLKEYLLRGLIRSVLILTPSSLVNQWQEELRAKFDLAFVSSNDALFRQDIERFWAEQLLVVSLPVARSKRHFQAVTSRSYDLVIVDEAHHLKNQRTKSWKLVNSIQNTFLLLLTATPVQNNLEELFNLVTILKPGHLKTLKSFKDQFVTRGNPTDPRNREVLRRILKEVMVRNTRSASELRLPPRFAFTTRVGPSDTEHNFYSGISGLVSDCSSGGIPGVTVMALRKLLEAAGSSHYAALRSLEKLHSKVADETGDRVHEILCLGKNIGVGSKTRKVIQLAKSVTEQKIIFVNYLATLEHLQKVLTQQRIPHVVFRGGMTSARKKAAIEDFRGGCPVLLATGTGGEGHNLQFCNVMINYDLPWNPMEIEQRIGRIHRIGQKKEVQVYNFCSVGSIEDHILDVLDRKINMFELVVGEVDMILGRLQDDKDFGDMVFEIWQRHSDAEQRKKAFDALGSRLKRARTAYDKSKDLDEKLFQEDFGV